MHVFLKSYAIHTPWQLSCPCNIETICFVTPIGRIYVENNTVPDGITSEKARSTHGRLTK